jgi:hypothetical protein
MKSCQPARRLGSALAIVAAIAGDRRIVTERPAGASESVTLRAGQTVGVDAGRATVGFDRVESDTRCPVGHRCISAGQAIVRVWVETAGRSRVFALVRGPSRTMATVVSDYRIRLARLLPYPGANGSDSWSGYAATLVVTVPSGRPALP